jgi:hypothetical protein
MTEAQTVEWPFDEDTFDITLESVEFDTRFQPDPEDDRTHLTEFVFRLHIGEGYQPFHVTMTAPYEDMTDLHRQAWTELYALLRQLGEAARRKADHAEMTFATSKD